MNADEKPGRVRKGFKLDNKPDECVEGHLLVYNQLKVCLHALVQLLDVS